MYLSFPLLPPDPGKVRPLVGKRISFMLQNDATEYFGQILYDYFQGEFLVEVPYTIWWPGEPRGLAVYETVLIRTTDSITGVEE